jgi:hypothetical protein
VFCPKRSVCFSEKKDKTDPTWEWNILHNETEGIVDDCEIWTGASSNGCDRTSASATKVDKFTISSTSVKYELEPTVYLVIVFHLYAGKCRENDGTGNFWNGGFCSSKDICDNADVFETFPLVSNNNGPYVDPFIFDQGYRPNSRWPSK